mmetsp:Transcript_34419/g.97526  ORF Transcript_34419/g.97526 Transcript_34419/m.97526 type:complete len:241 (-) Transcript_34419:1291-2013(-)
MPLGLCIPLAIIPCCELCIPLAIPRWGLCMPLAIIPCWGLSMPLGITCWGLCLPLPIIACQGLCMPLADIAWWELCLPLATIPWWLSMSLANIPCWGFMPLAIGEDKPPPTLCCMEFCWPPCMPFITWEEMPGEVGDSSLPFINGLMLFMPIAPRLFKLLLIPVVPFKLLPILAVPLTLSPIGIRECMAMLDFFCCIQTMALAKAPSSKSEPTIGPSIQPSTPAFSITIFDGPNLEYPKA